MTCSARGCQAHRPHRSVSRRCPRHASIGFLVKSRALSHDMVAVMQAGRSIREKGAQPLLALDQRPRPEIFAVKVEKIEREEDQRRRVAAVRSELHDVERRSKWTILASADRLAPGSRRELA